MESNSPHSPILPIYYASAPPHCPALSCSSCVASSCTSLSSCPPTERNSKLWSRLRRRRRRLLLLPLLLLGCLPCLVLSLSAASLLLVSACPLKCVNLQVCVCVRAGGRVCSLLSSSSASSTFSCRNRAHSGAQWQQLQLHFSDLLQKNVDNNVC